MREILFKGKRVDNGKWIQGNYVRHNPLCVCFEGERKPDKHYIGYDGFCDWGFEPPLELVEVIPETVGAFTGYYDKNGKRVFEGDILKSEFESDGEIFVEYLKVFWSDEEAAFLCWNDCQKDIPMRMEKYIFENAEVIDNIHDNPELWRWQE